MRQTVGAFMTGDIPLLLDGFAENVLWYSPGDTPASGRFRGREGVRRFFTMMDEVNAGAEQHTRWELAACDGNRGFRESHNKWEECANTEALANDGIEISELSQLIGPRWISSGHSLEFGVDLFDDVGTWNHLFEKPGECD